MQDKNRLLLLAALILALGVIVVDSWLITVPRWLGSLLLGAALVLLAIYWLRRPREPRQGRNCPLADPETDTQETDTQETDTQDADQQAADLNDADASAAGGDTNK